MLAALLLISAAHAQTTTAISEAEKAGRQPGAYYALQPRTESLDLSMYERIRTEGMTHGHSMDFASALADGIGPRLTGSPNMKRANEWTRDMLTTIGLANAHLENWGEFGMGWSQVNAWARMVSPDTEPIWLQAAVWSASTPGPVTGEIVYLSLADAAQLKAVQGKLKGEIVLLGAVPPATDLSEPLSFRYTDDELKELEGPNPPRRAVGPPPQNAPSRIERGRVNLCAYVPRRWRSKKGLLQSFFHHTKKAEMSAPACC